MMRSGTGRKNCWCFVPFCREALRLLYCSQFTMLHRALEPADRTVIVSATASQDAPEGSTSVRGGSQGSYSSTASWGQAQSHRAALVRQEPEPWGSYQKAATSPRVLWDPPLSHHLAILVSVRDCCVWLCNLHNAQKHLPRGQVGLRSSLSPCSQAGIRGNKGHAGFPTRLKPGPSLLGSQAGPLTSVQAVASPVDPAGVFSANASSDTPCTSQTGNGENVSHSQLCSPWVGRSTRPLQSPGSTSFTRRHVGEAPKGVCSPNPTPGRSCWVELWLPVFPNRAWNGNLFCNLG